MKWITALGTLSSAVALFGLWALYDPNHRTPKWLRRFLSIKSPSRQLAVRRCPSVLRVTVPFGGGIGGYHTHCCQLPDGHPRSHVAETDGQGFLSWASPEEPASWTRRYPK